MWRYKKNSRKTHASLNQTSISERCKEAKKGLKRDTRRVIMYPLIGFKSYQIKQSLDCSDESEIYLLLRITKMFNRNRSDALIKQKQLEEARLCGSASGAIAGLILTYLIHEYSGLADQPEPKQGFIFLLAAFILIALCMRIGSGLSVAHYYEKNDPDNRNYSSSFLQWFSSSQFKFKKHRDEKSHEWRCKSF